MPLLCSFTTAGQGIADFVADPFLSFELTVHHLCVQVQQIQVEQTDFPSIYRLSHFLNTKTRNHSY